MNQIKCYIKKIHNRLDASFNRTLQNYELTSTQFDILAYLAEDAESRSTLTDIAAHFGVKHTSAIHVLKVLEKKGFIEKNKSSDARSKIITLTGLGQQIIEAVRNKEPCVNKIVFAGLSESEQQLLEKMLHKIYQNIESNDFEDL
ncbi:MAG: winged helix-turn-helix transcriptional regulator [Ruminococcus sp.]|jgi:DNA-binding MarR family transcriptional regulator|nr:winged helix-turn-helix transcriptional regulator [Ruminococcus sp.]